MAIGIQPVHATIYTILDGNTKNGTGFGAWSGNTFTFNSSPNPRDSIQIINSLNTTQDSYIIDGAGETIDLVDDSEGGIGVLVYNSSYITIMNLNVTNCSTGIKLGAFVDGFNRGVNHIDLIDNNVSNCQHGIYMFRAGTCISEPGRSGITGNNIISNVWGIEIHSCDTINIYNNNFDNEVQAELKIDPSNFPNVDIYFNLDLPTGGNYWSDYNGLDNGENSRIAGDGIGDTLIPHLGFDNYPWILPNGWSIPPLSSEPDIAILDLIGYVTSMNLQNGIDNSLDAKLDAALNALDEIGDNNDVAAINSLNAFINSVEAQRGNKISNEDAEFLIAAAEAIINML